MLGRRGRGNCEKVGRWTRVKGNGLGGRGCPLRSYGACTYHPRKTGESTGANLFNFVQFHDIRSSEMERKIDAFACVAHFVPLGEEIPLERGHQTGVPPNKSLFYHY